MVAGGNTRVVSMRLGMVAGGNTRVVSMRLGMDDVVAGLHTPVSMVAASNGSISF